MGKRLKKLFQEDQIDRKKSNFDINWSEITKRDKARAKEIRKILNEIKKSGYELGMETLYYASFIFHHQSSKSAIVKARSLSKQGVGLCVGKNTKICKKIRWLYAASTDRLFMRNNKPQKYGTQCRRKKNSKEYELYNVDPKTKDEERTIFNVPTLTDAKKFAKNFR